MTAPPINLTQLRAEIEAGLAIPSAEALALIDTAEAAIEADIDNELQRIRGIADADGGRLLGDYGFQTIKDALYNINRKQARLRDSLARYTTEP